MNYQSLIPALNSVISLIMAVYLFIYWRKQGAKNISTLAWVIGLFSYSLNQLGPTLNFNEFFKLGNNGQEILRTIRLILVNFSLLCFYWGVARLIFRKHLWIDYLPSIIFVTMSFFVIFRIEIFESAQAFFSFYAYAFIVPVAFLLAVIFLVFYGVLVAEESGRNLGSLLIAVSWLIYGVQSIFLPQASVREGVVWPFVRLLSLIFLLVGLVFLVREAKHYFAIHPEELKIKKKHL